VLVGDDMFVCTGDVFAFVRVMRQGNARQEKVM
jgi:hypothetical protein